MIFFFKNNFFVTSPQTKYHFECLNVCRILWLMSVGLLHSNYLRSFSDCNVIQLPPSENCIRNNRLYIHCGAKGKVSMILVKGVRKYMKFYPYFCPVTDGCVMVFMKGLNSQKSWQPFHWKILNFTKLGLGHASLGHGVLGFSTPSFNKILVIVVRWRPFLKSVHLGWNKLRNSVAQEVNVRVIRKGLELMDANCWRFEITIFCL